MNTGYIVQISGPVVDVKFEEDLPKIQDALIVTTRNKDYVMEVSHHVGDGIVRCIMLTSSEGLSKDLPVIATGTDIHVPVGEATLGRLFNVLGETIDNEEPINEAPRWSILCFYTRKQG